MVRSWVGATGAALAIIVLAVLAGWLALSMRQSRRENLRAEALPVTIAQAQPIIRAIERYERERGNSPKTLADLQPKYIRSLPDAGPAARNGWHYQICTEGHPDCTWKLFILVKEEYSPNVIGFGDTFVYAPEGKYLDVDFGGGLRRFRDWGYYVE